MGAASLEEAVAKVHPFLKEWRPFLPLDGRYQKTKAASNDMTPEELAVLRSMAAGKDEPTIARELRVPATTIQGRRGRICSKLGVHCKEAAVAKAVELGIIGPNEPSSALLLRAYKRLASPEYADLVAQHRLKAPTPRQMQCLQTLADGLTAEQTGAKMGVGFQAVVFMRQRLWIIVRADSLRTALEQVQQLGILDWPDVPAEEEKKCQP